MVTDQTVIRCLSLLRQFQPSLTLLQNLLTFKIEVPPYDCLETFGRSTDVIDHCKFDVTVSDDIGICLVLLLPLESPLLMLKTRLVEVYVLAHDDGLDTDKHLQESGNFGVPIFHG